MTWIDYFLLPLIGIWTVLSGPVVVTLVLVLLSLCSFTAGLILLFKASLLKGKTSLRVTLGLVGLLVGYTATITMSWIFSTFEETGYWILLQR